MCYPAWFGWEQTGFPKDPFDSLRHDPLLAPHANESAYDPDLFAFVKVGILFGRVAQEHDHVALAVEESGRQRVAVAVGARLRRLCRNQIAFAYVGVAGVVGDVEEDQGIGFEDAAVPESVLVNVGELVAPTCVLWFRGYNYFSFTIRLHLLNSF